MSYTIVMKDTATPRLNELRESLTPRRLAAAVGPACARLVQQHLRTIGPNKRGWPTTNFWARAAKATSWAQMPDGVKISVNQVGVRQRFFGGAILPVRKQALAIPISPVSYGHVPSDFPGLFLIKTAKGAYLVQHGTGLGGTKKARATLAHGLGGNTKSRSAASLNFLFKLSPGVLQGPDPSVMPDMSLLRAAANKAVIAAVIKRDNKED